MKTIPPAFLLAVSVLLSWLLAACGSAASLSPNATPPPGITNPLLPTRTPFQPQSPSPEAGKTATSQLLVLNPPPAPAPSAESRISFWLAPYLPAALQKSLVLPNGITAVQDRPKAQLRLDVDDQAPLCYWIYALVAPYPTVPDGVSFEDIKRSWQGESAGPFAGRPLLMDESTYGVFSAWWGVPAKGATKVLPEDELVGYAWEHRPAWAIVPFEALEPLWKVLEVDGQSPLRKEFDPSAYILNVPFSLQGDQEAVARFMSLEQGTEVGAGGLPASNRDPDKLTTVALTGVTALVRATAYTMHQKGITYPARDIGEILRDADLTHISNEIPFTPDCPPPNPTQEGLVFCSDPDYIALLEAVGTDIVELTGDHFGDWGPEAMEYTLDMYEQRGWLYYGGGHNRKDARQARLVEHNGNRLAFIGCNAKGGGYATASSTQPGAVACDYDWMHREIARLNAEGYLVISTFQHFEYYTYSARPDQVRDFRGMAKAGAVIVSGSQAHQPQAMDFVQNSFIHYGLGNLFFDQYHYCTDNACDDGFIDEHVFYDGRYLGNELITIKFEDYARPRLMTPDERAKLLETIFRASGW